MVIKRLIKRMRRGRNLMNKRGQMAMATGTEQRVMQAINHQRATEVIVQPAKINRFGIIRMAGFLGLYGAFIGLIFGIVVFALVSLTTLLGVSFIGFTLGAFSILVYPLTFGATAFISGLIFTLLMNLVLKIIGGVSLTIEA